MKYLLYKLHHPVSQSDVIFCIYWFLILGFMCCQHNAHIYFEYENLPGPI